MTEMSEITIVPQTEKVDNTISMDDGARLNSNNNDSNVNENKSEINIIKTDDNIINGQEIKQNEEIDITKDDKNNVNQAPENKKEQEHEIEEKEPVAQNKNVSDSELDSSLQKEENNENVPNKSKRSIVSMVKDTVSSMSLTSQRRQTFGNLSQEEQVALFENSKPGDFADISEYDGKVYPIIRNENKFRRTFQLKKEKRTKKLVYQKTIEAPSGHGATFDYYKLYVNENVINAKQEDLQQNAIQHMVQGQTEVNIMKHYNDSPYFVHVYTSSIKTFSVSQNEVITSPTSNVEVHYGKDEIKWLRARIYLEYCSKGSLHDNLKICSENKELRYKWFMQCLISISLMHRDNISHNDIKTQNFLITNQNDCKAADFGAIQIGKTFSQANEYTGFFAAPELFNNINTEYNLYHYDMFSLGITFWMMLEGEEFIAWVKRECIGLRLATEKNEVTDFNDYKSKCKLFGNDINIIEYVLIINMIKFNDFNRLNLDQCIQLVDMLINNIICTNEQLENIINNKNYKIDAEKLQMLIEKYSPKNDLITYEKPPPTKLEKIINNFGLFILIAMIITWIILISISISVNKNADSASTQTIIGWTIFNMIISPIIVLLIGLSAVKMWTNKSWHCIFISIYVLLLIDIGGLQGHILAPLLIMYMIIKIAVFGLAVLYAKIDGKYFFPTIIEETICNKFLKEKSELFNLWKYFLLCLIIQICIFSLACSALLNMNNIEKLSGVRIAAFVFTIWIINVPRHFCHYIGIRMLTNCMEQNESTENIREAFKSAKKKLTTIAIGSFFVTISPFWNFLANLMWFLKYVGKCLIACGVASEEERRKRTENGWIIPLCCCCVGGIIHIFSYIGEKISKFILSITSKSILTISSINDIDYFHAVVTQFKILKESKQLFQAKMLFLDNGMTQLVTHLCILSSSIGCWITINIDPSISFIVWIAGYSASRTAFEIIDLILQFFLITWSIRPELMYGFDDDNILLKLEDDFKKRGDDLQKALGDNEKQTHPNISQNVIAPSQPNMIISYQPQSIQSGLNNYGDYSSNPPVQFLNAQAAPR